MRRIVSFLISVIILSSLTAEAASYTPGELIENFYSSRRMMHKTALEILGYSKLSGTGKKAAEEVLYDYTVIETATVGNTASYAEVEIKKRVIDSGIRVQKEFWKMSKDEGRWIIRNIYTPEEWQIKKAVRPGSSLPEKVEALASFEYEYQVEDVPPGTPIQKAYAYISRRDYSKAFYWADLSVKQKSDAESYFVRGILNLVNKRQAEGQSDINRAIRMNPAYYYVLQSLINGSSSGGSGGTSGQQDSTVRTMKGGVKGLFQ
jgi:hypothetical protein